MADHPFRRVAILGAGLMGTSIAHAVRARGQDVVVRFADRDPAAVAVLGEIFPDSLAGTDPVAAVAEADLVILCVPVGAVGVVAGQIAGHVKPGATVTDVGSVKRAVLEEMAAAFGQDVHVVAGHPVAGSERSGPRAGFAEMFENRYVILTPGADADGGAVAALEAFWRSLGAMVEVMDAAHHDLVLALTSHLPHLIAYTIVGTAADFESVTEGDVMRFSAGGFRDFTRIAASDPVMWRDVFLTNRGAVLEMLGRFTEDLTALQRAIRSGDGDTLFDLFTRTRAIRRQVIEQGQDDERPDFGREHGE